MTLTGDGPKLDVIVFGTPSTSEVGAAVVDRGRGPGQTRASTHRPTGR